MTLLALAEEKQELRRGWQVEAQFREHGVQGSFEAALREVMHKDPEMRSLDKQYAALEAVRCRPSSPALPCTHAALLLACTSARPPPCHAPRGVVTREVWQMAAPEVTLGREAAPEGEVRFVRRRTQVGAPSTRDLLHLGVMLDAH